MKIMKFAGKPGKLWKEKSEKSKRFTKRDARGRKVSSVFLSPSVLGVLVFFVIPFFVVFFYSVVDNPISHQFVFLDNLRQYSKMRHSGRLLPIR